MTNRNDYYPRNLRSEFDAARVLAGDAPMPVLRVLEEKAREEAARNDAPSYFQHNAKRVGK